VKGLDHNRQERTTLTYRKRKWADDLDIQEASKRLKSVQIGDNDVDMRV